MKLTKEDVGKQFNTHGGEVVTVIYNTGTDGELFVIEHDDKSGVYMVDINGRVDDDCFGNDLTSCHDPRTWLAQIPDLGDIKDGYLHYSVFGWFYSTDNTGDGESSMGMFNMPRLNVGQSKQSRISIAELKQWQLDNKGEQWDQ